MRTLHVSRPTTPLPASPPGPTSDERTSGTAAPLLWMAGGMALFFLVPYVGTDLAGLQPDLYYLCYFTIAAAWSGAFLVTYRDRLHDLWRLNLPWSLAIGAMAGIAVAAIVLRSAGTDHPEGWRWWFEIGWRGLVYSGVDAMTLFVFPTAVAYLLMRGDRTGAKRKIGYAGLVLSLSLMMSASYHLGYAEYRDADLRSPLIGTVMADSAAVLTGNPVGAFVTHGSAHASAVVHQNEGGPTKMLPPEEDADYPSHGDQDLAVGLAGLWLLLAAGAGIAVARRRDDSSM